MQPRAGLTCLRPFFVGAILVIALAVQGGANTRFAPTVAQRTHPSEIRGKTALRTNQCRAYGHLLQPFTPRARRAEVHTQPSRRCLVARNVCANARTRESAPHFVPAWRH